MKTLEKYTGLFSHYATQGNTPTRDIKNSLIEFKDQCIKERLNKLEVSIRQEIIDDGIDIDIDELHNESFYYGIIRAIEMLR